MVIQLTLIINLIDAPFHPYALLLIYTLFLKHIRLSNNTKVTEPKLLTSFPQIESSCPHLIQSHLFLELHNHNFNSRRPMTQSNPSLPPK